MSDQPALRAQDRLAFLLSLVAYLKEHERVEVAETAARFGVTADQVRDAVRLLAISGVPGVSNAYLPGDLFDIAWDDFEQHDEIVLTNLVAIDDTLRFSAREASALIAGLQYLSTLPGAADGVAVAALMEKLARGASAAPTGVAIDSGSFDATLHVINRARTAGVQMRFDYRNAKGERRVHTVDPLRVDSGDTELYLRAWDHDSDALRTYRVDRMSDPEPLQTPVSGRAAEVIIDDALFAASDDDVAVTLDVVPAALPLLTDYLDDEQPATEAGDRIRVVVQMAHFHALKRLAAGLPGLVEVVSPPAARQAVHDWAARGAERYQRSLGDAE